MTTDLYPCSGPRRCSSRRALPCELHPRARDGDVLDRVRPGLAAGPSLKRRLDRSYYCVGGSVALAGRSLAKIVGDPAASETKAAGRDGAICAWLAHRNSSKAAPVWLGRARRRLESSDRTTATELRGRTRASIRAGSPMPIDQLTGEGLHETLRRRRVEHAVQLLRSTRRADRGSRGYGRLLRPEPPQPRASPADGQDAGADSRRARALKALARQLAQVSSGC